ncbi:MAG: ATP-binding protein [Ferrovibrionaceae bacterium]
MNAAVLAHPETAWRSAVDVLDVALALFDADDRLVGVNRCLADLNPLFVTSLRPGIHFSDYVDQALKAGFIDLTNDSREDFVERLHRRFAAADGSAALVTHLDGTVVRARFYRLDGGGKLMVRDDITRIYRAENDRRQAEERFAHLMANMRGIIVYRAAPGEPMRAWGSDRIGFGQVIGPDGVVDLDLWYRLIAPEDLDRYLTAERARREHGAAFTVEFRYRSPGSAAWMWATESGWTVTDPVTGAQYYDGFVLDISDAKRREAELAEAHTAAEAANRAKSTFLANMSHELRTPLSAIIGFSDVMIQGVMGPVTPARYREYIGDIHASARHLLSLIQDILDLAKAESGRAGVREEEVDLAELATGVLRMLGPRAEEGQVMLRHDWPPALPRVRGESRKLRQILINLLSNAVKFTPAGGEVHVEIRRAEGAGIEIVIADTGVGMSSTEIPRAFESFVQLESGLARAAEGTGLGLPLTRALIEQHDGTIGISSEPGRGTTVTVRLPPGRIVPS